MNKFKAGDKVIRVGSDFYVMKVGDIVTVRYSWVDSAGNDMILLEENDGTCYAKNFELVQPAFKAMKFKVTSPEQSKEIQEALFSMGYKWTNYGTEIMWENDGVTTYLHTDSKGALYRCDRDPDCFEVHQEYTIKTAKSYTLIPVEIPKEELVELMGQKYSKKELEDALRGLKPIE